MREHLRKRLAFIPTRYKVDLPLAEATDLLTVCYQYTVAIRGVKAVMDESTTDKIAKAAQWLTDGTKPGLMLYGTVGNGKTTLVRAIQEMIRLLHNSAISSKSKGLRFITAMELAKLAKDKPEDFDRIIRSELLAIDDVGTEPETVRHYGNVITPITDALFYRYEQQLFTVCTTNLDMESLRERYDERIYDRMIEMFNRIAYTNESYRKLATPKQLER